jgi:integrase
MSPNRASDPTDASNREVVLADFATEALQRAIAMDLPGGPYNLVFPSLYGRDKLRQPSNVRDWLANLVKGTPWEQFPGTHIFRKTVATAVANDDEAGGIEAAAKLLGHVDSVTTRKHYVERVPLAPDVSSTLNRFDE